MAFKVKYRTRQKLQRAIQQQIRRLGLVDTRAMEDSIRISSTAGDLNKITITVNALYYYFFHDNGADLWNGGILAPQNITQKALESNNGRKFLDETVEAYINFLSEEYPILEVANLKIDPQIVIEYQLFGDPTGKWNGTFEETLKVNIT